MSPQQCLLQMQGATRLPLGHTRDDSRQLGGGCLQYSCQVARQRQQPLNVVTVSQHLSCTDTQQDFSSPRKISITRLPQIFFSQSHSTPTSQSSCHETSLSTQLGKGLPAQATMSAASLRARVSESLAWPRQASPKLRNVSEMLALRTTPAIDQMVQALRTRTCVLFHTVSH